MTESQAVDLGQRALLWLLGREEALEAFLGASGAGVGDLRAGADDPAFLGFVLDFVLGSDAMVLDLAQAEGVRPEAVMRARTALPGGGAPDWT